jgi:hypothetical protein
MNRSVGRNRRERERERRDLPVAEQGLEVDDELLLLVGEVTALDPWAEVVGPPQPAALAAAHQPWIHRNQ